MADDEWFYPPCLPFWPWTGAKGTQKHWTQLGYDTTTKDGIHMIKTISIGLVTDMEDNWFGICTWIAEECLTYSTGYWTRRTRTYTTLEPNKVVYSDECVQDYPTSSLQVDVMVV